MAVGLRDESEASALAVIAAAREFEREWREGDGADVLTCDCADALVAALAAYDAAVAARLAHDETQAAQR